MQSERWQQVQELFLSASQYEGRERHLFLLQACGQDQDLHREVLSLLAYDSDAEQSITSPPLRVASQMLEEWEQQLSRAGEAGPDPMIGQMVSRYRIVEKLGAGGMGVVYKAEDSKLGRFVALKFLPQRSSFAGANGHFVSISGYSSTALERCEREARASSALDHPNICTVHEVDQHEGSPFIVMQLLAGQTLKREVNGHPLPADRVVDLGIQIADALDAAHSAGIIHRDIKPANIFVTPRGDAKVLDFGLAKLAPKTATGHSTPPLPDGFVASNEETLTVPGMAFGTVAYMSPEQVSGNELDARTDLFSLGTLLYEMATGKPPFSGQTTPALQDAILHQTLSPPSSLNPELPLELDRIVCKTLEKDPGRRYQSAAELRDDLRALKHDSAAVEIRTPARLRPWIFAIALTLLLALAVLAYAYLHKKKSDLLTERDTIVLADFSNSTGDPIFDETLKQALRAQLEQSPFLNVLSERKALQELAYMGRPRSTRLTDEVARELCARTGSKAMVLGSISTLGTHYAVGLEALNCQSGDSLGTEQSEAESREGVLRALGEAAARLRARLGESLASIQKYDAPVEQATTKSIQALRAYSLGIKTKLAEGDEAAIPFFQRAIDLDPDFAMAYIRMGTAYSDLNQPTRARMAISKAYTLRDHVSERERFYIDSHYYDTVTGQEDKAIEVYQLWEQTYPRDPTPFVDLGVIYGALGDHAKDLAEQGRALQLAPGLSVIYGNMANAYINLNQFDKAVKLLAQAHSLSIEDATFPGLRYQLAFVRGDQEEMQRQVNQAMGRPGPEGSLLALQADSEAYYGHLAKARELTQRAIESALRNGDHETAAGYQIIGALREAEFGNLQRARRQIANVAMGSSQQVVTVGALALARAGETNRVLAIARDLHEQFPSDTLINNYWLPTVRAAAELAQANPEKALELLQETMPYELGVPLTQTNVVPYPVYVRGMAYLAAGQGNEAATEFQKIVDHAGIVANFPLGALARLGLGRAYALEAGIPVTASNPGQREGHSKASGPPRSDALAKARSAYQEFFALWEDADPDVPILQQARNEYRNLAQ